MGKDYENKWSNFGGRAELSDKSDYEITATRECWEETLGAIYDYPDLKNVVKRSGHKHLVFKTPSGHPYYMFVIKIPFHNNYRDKFLSTKKFLTLNGLS